MVCVAPEPGESIGQTVDRLVAAGQLDPVEGEIVHDFAAYLRDTRDHGHPSTWGPNLLRRHRATLGLTDGEIVAVEHGVARGTRGWPGE